MNCCKWRPRYNIAMLLGLTLACAVGSWFLIVRNDSFAEVVLLDPSGSIELTHIQDAKFLRGLCDDQNFPLNQLTTYQLKEWIHGHVTVTRMPGTELVSIRVSGNSYRENPENFLPALNVIIETLITEIGRVDPQVRMAVVSAPVLYE